MRVSIVCLGTRGDLEPSLALAEELAGRGHLVRVATAEGYRREVQDVGADFFPIEGEVRTWMQGEEGRALVLTSDDFPLFAAGFVQSMRGSAEEMLVGVERAIAGADVCICSMMVSPARLVSQRHGIPFVQLQLAPILETSEFPAFGTRHRPELGPSFNRVSHRYTADLLAEFSSDLIRLWKARLGLVHGYQAPVRIIGAYSSSLVERPSDWPPHSEVVGFLRREQRELSASLEAFLAAGPAPVCVGFGSMTESERPWLLSSMLQVILARGLRAVVLGGWQDAAISASDDVYFAESASHDALYPRCAVVVHHAGAGTTGAALLAGRPQVPVPFFADQFFWSERLRAAGLGSRAVARRSFSKDIFSECLDEALSLDAGQIEAARIAATGEDARLTIGQILEGLVPAAAMPRSRARAS